MFNRVTEVGRITADPELRKTESNISFVKFALAVDRDYVPKGGERETDFFEVVAWRQTAEFICRHFKKGSILLVEGSLQVNSYTDDVGIRRKGWEIVAKEAHFVGYSKRPEAEDSSD